MNPYYQLDNTTLYHSDIMNWCHNYTGKPFHAIVCDPPYHLTDPKNKKGSKGFMGQQWDGGDIAFRPELWKELAKHLYPGGFIMAFSSARGWHRLACAMEDAGLILHPTFYHRATGEELQINHMAWLNGQGNPKPARLDKWIDAQAGVERKELGKRKGAGSSNTYSLGVYQPEYVATQPETELAQAWSTHRYGLGAIKPATEPIIIAQKPYDTEPRDSLIEYGAGAYNIEGARVGTDTITINRWTDGAKPFGDGAGHGFDSHQSSGRWPAHFVQTHSPLCTSDECVEYCPLVSLDEQSGTKKSSFRHVARTKKGWMHGGLADTVPHKGAPDNYGDAGGASRFFYAADWLPEVMERLALADDCIYCPKPAPKEKHAGLDKNVHPTVKPIWLIHHLARLLLPPSIYKGRILVPFAGSGSEMIGCQKAGWHEIVGVELTESYAAINKQRIGYWLVNELPGLIGNRSVSTLPKAVESEPESDQLSLNIEA